MLDIGLWKLKKLIHSQLGNGYLPLHVHFCTGIGFRELLSLCLRIEGKTKERGKIEMIITNDITITIIFYLELFS